MDKRNIVSNLSSIHLEEKASNNELIDIRRGNFAYFFIDKY
jgi:hypothetical protein